MNKYIENKDNDNYSKKNKNFIGKKMQLECITCLMHEWHLYYNNNVNIKDRFNEKFNIGKMGNTCVYAW